MPILISRSRCLRTDAIERFSSPRERHEFSSCFAVDYPISLLSQFCMERHCAKVHRDLVNFQTPGRKPAQKRKLNPASACLIFKHCLVKFSVLNARCGSRNTGKRLCKVCIYVVKTMLMLVVICANVMALNSCKLDSTCLRVTAISGNIELHY